MKKVIYGLMGFALILTSCETMEKRDEGGSVLTVDQVKITVIQPTAGSNTIIFHNETVGAIIYYDWGTGTLTSRDEYDTIYIPFASTPTLKYTAFCGGGTVTGSTTFTIAANDDAYFDTDPAWKGLTGGGAGQTWVFALDIPGGVIAGNGPEDCQAPAWWTINVSSPPDWLAIYDEVTLNLNGAANFTYKAKDGSIKTGFFKVIDPAVFGGVSYSGIQTLNGVTFPWPNPSDGKYHITKLTTDLLSLHEYKQYNIAMYKRKGYVYP
ncbi:MAG: hypothetical protein NTZ85_03725 [Bacteroidia bacterium]|nr:hypothetical protein [Bacteroidia bacterium]